jgi:formylglycine-generating enzyme required for sulfatase activity
MGRDARQQKIASLSENPRSHADLRSVLRELGEAQWMQGHLADAERTYRRLVEVDQSVGAASDLVQIQLQRGHYHDAAQTARTSGTLNGASSHPEWLRQLEPQLAWFTGTPANDVQRRLSSTDETVLVDSIGMRLVRVPGGRFARGTDDGDRDTRPARLVEVAAFLIGQYEVTLEHFLKFIAESGYRYVASAPVLLANTNHHLPIAGVSWLDAQAFTMWLSATTGARYRLPTEAEWELAARGFEGHTDPWGSVPGQPQKDGNWGLTATEHLKSPLPPVRPVGSYPRDRSVFGVMDLAGNVSEWCLDEYDPTYFAWSPDDNPQGPVEMRGVKVRRGGSWNSPWSNGFAVRRSHSASNLPYTGFGFRVVRELD